MLRILTAALLAFPLGAWAADPVAFVADIRGNATIEGDGKLNFLAELAPGTRVLLGTGATVAITYAATGAEFTLTGPGEFVVAAGEVRADKGPAPKRRTVANLPDPSVVGRIARAASASLRMRGLPGMQSDARPVLEFPVDTRIASLRPMLRVRGEPAPGTTLRLLDAAGRELWKGEARAEGTVPGVKLSPATRYAWTVMTTQGALAEASFETLPAEAIARAEKSRSGKGFADRVMHAMLLQELGAHQEARVAWAALARERPDLPELAALAR